MNTTNQSLTFLAVILCSACGHRDGDADATGNFEAVETLISAKSAGELIDFRVQAGMSLKAGEPVGLIDTTTIALQRAEVRADRDAVASQAKNLFAQIAVQEAQLVNLKREEERLVKLVAGKAATTKQLDDMRGQMRVVEKQIGTIEAQNPGLVAQVRALDAKLAQIDQAIADHRIINPINGTVQVKLAEAHELLAPGKALYRIAQLDTLELRAYITGSQLAEAKLGAQVEVGIDHSDGRIARLPGRISWIASEAEFTPKTIQTREERVDMVYALKVRVANTDGQLKIGMPGEVYFTTASK